MIRGLQRHRKKGRRLFVLMALCSAALVFLLTFRSDFQQKNRDQVIGLQTGHLEILPPDSRLLANSANFTETEEVPLLHLGTDFDKWLHSLPEIEEAAPVISRYGNSYNIDSEYEGWISLIAVDAKRKERLFPVATVVSGSGDITWNEGMPSVPLLRNRMQTEWGEKNADASRFDRKELRMSDEKLPDFMSRISLDFPSIFKSAPYAGKEDLQKFLNDWKASLSDAKLFEKIPPKFTENYDWKIDDAVTSFNNNKDPANISFLNKRIFKALYPDDIAYLSEPIIPGKEISLQLAPFTTKGINELPVVIPAQYVGMCEIEPLYVPNSFIDINAFRKYMGLDDTSATAWVIRLKDIRALASVKAKIVAKLIEMGSDAKVADYTFLAQMNLTTGLAFGVVISILIVIFVVILLIFTINLVLMSMIQRRKEIGTGLALGLDNMQTVIIMTGEVAAIVVVSCIGGSLIGAIFVVIGMQFGIPGMIFFTGGKLYMTLQLMPFVLTWLIILPTSIIAAFIPLSRMRKYLPVDLLKEAT